MSKETYFRGTRDILCVHHIAYLAPILREPWQCALVVGQAIPEVLMFLGQRAHLLAPHGFARAVRDDDVLAQDEGELRSLAGRVFAAQVKLPEKNDKLYE